MSFCAQCAKPIKPGFTNCYACEQEVNPVFAAKTTTTTIDKPPPEPRCEACKGMPAFRRCQTCPDYKIEAVLSYRQRVQTGGRWTYLD